MSVYLNNGLSFFFHIISLVEKGLVYVYYLQYVFIYIDQTDFCFVRLKGQRFSIDLILASLFHLKCSRHAFYFA